MRAQEWNKLGALRFKPEFRFWLSNDQEHTPELLRIQCSSLVFSTGCFQRSGKGPVLFLPGIPKPENAAFPTDPHFENPLCEEDNDVVILSRTWAVKRELHIWII